MRQRLASPPATGPLAWSHLHQIVGCGTALQYTNIPIVLHRMKCETAFPYSKILSKMAHVTSDQVRSQAVGLPNFNLTKYAQPLVVHNIRCREERFLEFKTMNNKPVPPSSQRQSNMFPQVSWLLPTPRLSIL